MLPCLYFVQMDMFADSQSPCSDDMNEQITLLIKLNINIYTCRQHGFFPGHYVGQNYLVKIPQNGKC